MKKTLLIATAAVWGCATAGAIERFSTQQPVVVRTSGPSQASPSTPTLGPRKVVLRPGEIAEVFVFSDQFGVPRESFYVPLIGTRVVQLYMERHGRQDRWYVKGLARGTTVGGIVPRTWLDSSGFLPRSVADEMRIQAALKANAFYIEVK
jgi:hypothetical protein